MFKTLKRLFRLDREKIKIPRHVQDAIPIQTIYKDGIFRVGRQRYSKSFKFEDINYSTASIEDKKSIFFAYSELLNMFEDGATYKITVVSHRLGQTDFERHISIPVREDGLDTFRGELNAMLLEKATEADAIVQDKYITVSIHRRTLDEARTFFNRVEAQLRQNFQKLGSRFRPMSVDERLRILYEFYRGKESEQAFDLPDMMKRGFNVKDTICPDSMEFDKDHFKVGDKYGRVLFLKTYGNFIQDNILAELTKCNRNMMLSIDIIPIPTAEGIQVAEKIQLGTETNIANYQRKQNQNNNFSSAIPYDMELQRKESRDFLDDLVARDQRIFLALITIVHIADTKEQLDSDTETLLVAAHSCQVAPLTFQQLDGLNTVLPVGALKIKALRTLTTESLSVFMPFTVQEVMDRGGLYFGQNARSKNLILMDKAQLQNLNAFRLGVPGSGKSFGAKMEIVLLALMTGDDILVADPENEYGPLIQALGGEVIRIAAGSDDHINCLDMVEGYSDGSDPLVEKTEFVMSLFERMTQSTLGAGQKSIIGRCLRTIYHDLRNGGPAPTLKTLWEELKKQREPQARELALALELFADGTQNVFAHETNVNIKNRLIAYNIKDLGELLKPVGLLVITDAILNRVTENWKNGKRTHIIIDEFHVMFENPHSAAFFDSAWRRFRKRNACPTGITQNVEYLLHSTQATSMLSNSELLVIHKQSPSDGEELSRLLNISPEQMNYITGTEEGCGLLKIGNALVPFKNEFPKHTQLYKLMTTKPNEKFTPSA